MKRGTDFRGLRFHSLSKYSVPPHAFACNDRRVWAGEASREVKICLFATYTDSNRNEILRRLEAEAPSSKARLDLDRCTWRRNAKVQVRLEANATKLSNNVQTFLWNGSWQILRFDVEILDNTIVNRLILKFDIAVEGLPIMRIRPEIEVQSNKQVGIVSQEPLFVEAVPPKTAFASYSRLDQKEVLGRVRSLQIFTGIDVFLDCLSIRPGDEWKATLLNEILRRDIFWLFWSRSAKESEWVDWEWRAALASKSLKDIQPHPLESAELAPPPSELADLQFGARYEWYLSSLKESSIKRRWRAFCAQMRSAFGI